MIVVFPKREASPFFPVLTQSDLADCAPLSRISEILNGRREISKDLAKALADRFEVGVGVFESSQ
jgi:antitoxin component HigA of HigAB toxin-antitoxin module